MVPVCRGGYTKAVRKSRPGFTEVQGAKMDK